MANRGRIELNSARDIYRLKRRASVRKALGGLDYTRSVEYPALLNELALERAGRVLEIGSSKLFLAPYIALRHGLEVHATDPDPVVDLQRKWITALGRADVLESGRFVVAREDATRLSYPDEWFDRVVAVSTVEHIEAVERAASEIGRVLRPGGLAGLTVPFSTSFKAISVNHAVYGKPYDGRPQFYEYIFDRDSLEKRIIAPSGLVPRSLKFLGEPRLKMSRIVYNRGLGPPLSLLRWVWPHVAHRFLHPIPEQDVSAGNENIAVLILARPADQPRAEA